MRSLRSSIFAAAALAALAALTHVAHLAASSRLGVAYDPDEELPTHYLPPGDLVRSVSVGQATTVADLYFLKLVQYVGTPAAERAGWPQLLELAELITDVDPRFGYAYEVSGILLIGKHRFDEALQILEKGMERVPDRWQLPFFAAYVRWYELEQPERGAELLLRASRLPGRPAYVTELAARLYAHSGRVEAGLAHIEAMLRGEPAEPMRSELERRRTELLVELDLQRLEAAIAAFEGRFGRRPWGLEDLVKAGLIRAEPRAPDGSSYEYDAATGAVTSALLPKRIRLNAPPKNVTVSPEVNE